LLIPGTLQVVHAFDHDPDYKVVFSLDQDDNVHVQEECISCELLFNTTGLLQSTSYEIVPTLESTEYSYAYSFLKDYEALFYTLRGPPSL